MSKNIVICSDGTGNTAEKGRGTNVFKLYEAVDLHHDSQKQVNLYDDGVGTQSFNPWKLLSGAIGLGLNKNVIQLYTELAHLYNPGDRIFLFGFSRGAFTVRTLAGLIYQCGILNHDDIDDAELRDRAKSAYRAFRCRKLAYLEIILCSVFDIISFGRCCKKTTLAKVRQNYALKNEKFKTHPDSENKIIPPITMIGVWDTVSAMGFPIKEVSDLINVLIYRFKFDNKDLGKNVERAYHALSIDDERATFHPLMWNEDEDTRPKIEQVWFAGAHSNVGGGYPKHGMSLVALEWMLCKAASAGLVLYNHDRELFATHRNVNDKLYDPRSGIKAIYRYTPRNIGKICKDHSVQPKVHLSVFKRTAQSTEGYAPGNLPHNLEVVDNTGSTATSNAVQVLMRNAMLDTPSMLSNVSWSNIFRIGSHIVILAVLVFMFAKYLIDSSVDAGFWSVLSGLFSFDGLFSMLKHVVKHDLWLMVIVILLYPASIFAERHMKKYYSRFYQGLLKPMRKIFELTNEKVKLPE